MPAETATVDASSSLRSDAALIVVALIWGVNIPLMKSGLDGLDLFVFSAIRLSMSAAVLTAFAWNERRNGIRPAPGVRWYSLVVYGLVISAAYQLLFLLGISRTTSGNTGLILCTTPIWIAVFARVFINERLGPVAWTGLLVALVGTVVVSLQSGQVTAGRAVFIGNMLILCSAMAWAAGTVYSRPLLTKVSPLQLAAAASLVGLPFHLAFAAGSFGESLDNLTSPHIWGILAFAGVLSSGLALPLWNLGVRTAGAAHAAVVQNLVPLVAIITAWAMRSEPITLAQIIGGALILGGLFIMRSGRLPLTSAGSGEGD